MKKNVLIIGAGGVGNVVAHKCAQHNDILGDICIASRTVKKCDDIIKSVRKQNNLKDENKVIKDTATKFKVTKNELMDYFEKELFAVM